MSRLEYLEEPTMETHSPLVQHQSSDEYLEEPTIQHLQLSYEELSNIRIRQKNLVYVVGLPINLCDEQILRTSKWFGCFGKIKKISVQKKTSRNDSFAAFITFYRECDAMKAINSMNGNFIGHRIIKATTGSTKYCSYYLRNTTCTNPQCLYLHEWASKSDIVTKQELNDFGPIHHSNHSNHSGHSSNHCHNTHTHTSIIKKNNSKTSISKFDYTKKQRTKPPMTKKQVTTAVPKKQCKPPVASPVTVTVSKNVEIETPKMKKTHYKVAKMKKSYRKVAQLIISELMRNNQSNCQKSIKFKMSDLLKDGMLSYEELMERDQYNWWILQSDKMIFQQFQKAKA